MLCHLLDLDLELTNTKYNEPEGQKICDFAHKNFDDFGPEPEKSDPISTSGVTKLGGWVIYRTRGSCLCGER